MTKIVEKDMNLWFAKLRINLNQNKTEVVIFCKERQKGQTRWNSNKPHKNTLEKRERKREVLADKLSMIKHI